MIKKILLLSIIFFNNLVFSQAYTVTGKVLDEKQTPVAFANVVLMQDAIVIKGTTTHENGDFVFENINKGSYTLKISFLGYEAHQKKLQIFSTTSLGVVTLKDATEALEGVTVVAKKPTIKRMVDRLVFNVENSTLSNNTMLDVLKHTPGVLVFDGRITIKNSNPTVYINDRKVHLSASEVMQLLEATPANTIKSVEVITNPPAKYEAEGGAVLNIVTTKNLVAGYHGSVYGNYKQGFQFPKFSYGTSHFFKTNKLNTYLNFSDSPQKAYRNNDEFVNFYTNNTLTTSWETDYKRTRQSANKTINAHIDYDIDAKNSLSFNTNLLISPRTPSQTDVDSFTEVFDANKNLDSTFHTTNNAVLELFNMAFTLDYRHQFNKEGAQLSASLHHTNYDFSNFQDVNTGYFLPNTMTAFRNNKFQTFSSQVIKLSTAQTDFVWPLPNNALFETGVKVSTIDSESVLNQFSFENDIKQDDIDNSDVFNYDETNYAAYVSFEKDWKTWSFKAGFRGEYTDISSVSASLHQTNTNNYFKLFPSFNLLHRIHENHEVYFNYKKRIYRPRYNQLNPFKFFLNDNTFKIGDPNLLPQIDDVYTLGYNLNNTFTFELYYRYENNPALEVSFQDNDENLIKYISTNIDNSVSYGFDFTTYTPIIKDWSVYVLSSIFYYDNKFVALESDNAVLNFEKWTYLMQMVNYLSFLKDKSLSAEASLFYISPIVDGPSEASSRLGVDVIFRKAFWNNKASVSLGVTDIFNTLNFNYSTNYLNQDILTKSNIENRLFTLGFHYKFGNTKLKTNKRIIELEERDRLERNDK